MKGGVGSLLVAGWLVVCLASARAEEVFTLTSPQFSDNAPLEVKNAGNRETDPNCPGQNVSPALAWSNTPEGGKSVVLLMLDPEAQGGSGFSHMVVYGIPASVTGFAEGELSKPSEKYVGGKSGTGMATYAGPCPPPGTDWHHYTFLLVATDLSPSALHPGLTREELLAAIKPHAKATAGLVLRYRHP